MTLQFDPNQQKAPLVPEWATYTPHRKANWKVHSHKGHAKNAFYAHRDIILYHFEDGQWVEKCRHEGPMPEHCERCGTNMMRKSPYHPGTMYCRGAYIWSREDDLKFLCICPKCYWQIRFPKLKVPSYLEQSDT